MLEEFDVIVIGVGSMGSATCYELAKRGYKVLGIEQFSLAHENGSHSGQSRLIRESYFEAPEYVPILRRAYELWEQLERAAQVRLFYRTGIHYMGDTDHEMIQGVLLSGNKYNIPLDLLDEGQRKEAMPTFHFNESVHSVFERNAGFVLAEKSILTFCEMSIKKGARFILQTKVSRWNYRMGRFEVETSKGSFFAKKLILTSGAWTGQMASNLHPKLEVTQQTLAWFDPGDWASFSLGQFPCWMFSSLQLEGTFYGFPVLPPHQFDGPRGLKIAYHCKGKPVTADAKTNLPSDQDLDVLQTFVTRHLPSVGSLRTTKTCLYTYSHDANFYLDHLPGYEGDVAIACGFSGHGFKFSSVVGEILTDLITVGKTNLPIEFLRLSR